MPVFSSRTPEKASGAKYLGPFEGAVIWSPFGQPFFGAAYAGFRIGLIIKPINRKTDNPKT
jgi:hypothetical protein